MSSDHDRDEAAGRRLTRLLCTVTFPVCVILLGVGLASGDGELAAVGGLAALAVAFALVATNATPKPSTPNREDPTP